MERQHEATKLPPILSFEWAFPCTTHLLLLTRPASPDSSVQQGTLLAGQRCSGRPNQDLRATYGYNPL
jgi:hypothetical protein